MLVCPQCQFENPNTNKFCQRCGTSLTHKSCHECGTQVPVNAATCHTCSAFTGTVWLAIITKDPHTPVETQITPVENAQSVTREATPEQEPQGPEKIGLVPQESPEPTSTISPPAGDVFSDTVAQPLINSPQSDAVANVDETSSLQQEPTPTATTIYLDPQQRYRLLEPQSLEQITTAIETPYGAAVRVLDCQPFQKSPLEALLEQQQGQNSYDSSGSQKASLESWKILGIPAMAQPYLALRNSYYPTLPEVHDAWQQDGKVVVLLEDRSAWPLLENLWGGEELSSLQILYWLDEIAQLWDALEPWHCRQSLLEEANLRVDEDQALGLVRLYPEPQEQPLTLQDLGRMWQILFAQSQRTQFTALGAVFRQLCTDEISTIGELRSHLEAIAREQEAALMVEVPSFDGDAPMPAPPTPTITPATPEASPFPSFPLNEMNIGGDGDDQPTVILPMQLLSLDDAGCTDIGHQREHNEDSFGIQTLIKKQETPMGRTVQARGLYVLCDGMGGHAAGEVASALAVDTIKRYFQETWNDQLPSEDGVRESIRLANQSIYDVNQKNARSGSGRMGTTLAMVLIQNTKAVIAHVGDSRLYRLTRKQGLELVTVDHEVGQREIKRGVEPTIAYSRPDAYQLTQALGPRSEQFINPDVQVLDLNEDTLFVLCSDGLSDNDLIETHWQTHLAPLLSSRANLDQGILQLIELANEYNGHDNITAILIRVKVRPNFEQQQLL